ncbi:MAG: AraC family transcriptional regulator [Bacteroidota bacterium]|nr:AraC family transcriptional regulator [Bacteroidota bacterium]MDP4245902.1 AraC family transcriptional regulator [Bacteroidota bacterium]MDP4255183.1 AraC family transcriptional regulator [Bacteroidota bacterium]MDP4259232.1 AraC family transcriptional regulator [Bacteroidota bacterium]
MSYVSLENSEPLLKCFEVMAEDKSCMVTDSVLYLGAKSGKGFITAPGLPAGIEILGVNVSMLADDLTFSFLPSPNASSYILSFDEIGVPPAEDQESSYSYGNVPGERFHSSVSITDADHGKVLVYPRDREVRSLIVRVQKSSLGRLIHDFDAGAIQSILRSANSHSSLSWPITFKYRLLINDFMEEIVDHPFRELFAIRNVSVLVEYLLQQFFVMNKLEEDGNYLSTQDMSSLSRVEQHLCSNYKKEFPGIEKLSRVSAMSPTSLKTKFKKYYGETLFSYYQKNKLERARKLLDGKVPVKVVATEIGYSNPSHFTLAFKKEYGFSPWHYLNPQ